MRLPNWARFSGPLLAIACGGAPERAELAPHRSSPSVASSQKRPAPRPARVTSCDVTPRTAYADEQPEFVVSGDDAAGAGARASLRDERGRTLFETQLSVPGKLSVPSLESGDYVLSLGDSGVSCAVTINRELSRAGVDPR